MVEVISGASRLAYVPGQSFNYSVINRTRDGFSTEYLYSSSGRGMDVEAKSNYAHGLILYYSGRRVLYLVLVDSLLVIPGGGRQVV